jgi:UDP-N-acetylmuramyl pentapeptide phosphotransferase/UDP-N-acetylglucosamine-1-phosphate transferase
VRARLFATVGCGILGWAITGYAINRVNVPGFDWLLSFTIVSVLFTAFTVGGIANAINIIDGFNGLSGGTVIIILGGFAWTFLSVGDTEMAQVCILLGAAVLGFLLVNWPMGKIFLGDGGAYFVGFCIAWIAVLMLARHPDLSAWLPLLLCAYPVLEVVFSMWRRWRRGLSAGEPDRLHLHSLVKKRMVRQWLPNESNLARNSVTGMLMWGAALLPVAVALTVGNNTAGLAGGLVFCALVYTAVYARISQFVWCFRAATVAPLAKA